MFFFNAKKRKWKVVKKSLIAERYIARKHEESLNYSAYDPGLMRSYLIVCSFADQITLSAIFNNFILVCILIAGLLVGIGTYPTFQNNRHVMIVDDFVLYSFCCEVILKVLSEGASPQLYITGPEWKWNVFDFSIVLVSLLPIGAGRVKLLRLVRLLRLAKVFRRIPRLRMIIEGLIGGLESMMYIFLLMFLTFYMFSVAGMIFFGNNDPFHFHSVEISMLTMLRIATLDDWGDIFYLNYYGCDSYSGGYYTNKKTQVDKWCASLLLLLLLSSLLLPSLPCLSFKLSSPHSPPPPPFLRAQTLLFD
jgi:voltage-gated sodium channel